MTGVIFEDLIRPAYNKPISEKTASFIMKIIVVILGAICVALVFIVEHMGTLIQAGKSLAGITAGSLLGLFSMGLFLPWTNATGALAGGITSTILVGWISLGTQAAMMRGEIVVQKKPTSVDGCLGNVTISSTVSTLNDVMKYESGANDPAMVSHVLYTHGKPPRDVQGKNIEQNVSQGRGRADNRGLFKHPSYKARFREIQ
ncbi:Sodium-coupled monocarboxylate transporter 1 [Eumeta japonica]|uniref:Sodium-coupled monocarboxylate transporter 1 n=1 Tax=Eumeta variegata TaxID=151549 RepID=A0A4C1ZZU0_EUMVA|nr:Sodium-coupled monocarboxylate transporter 1 [Eumeta japonica]